MYKVSVEELVGEIKKIESFIKLLARCESEQEFEHIKKDLLHSIYLYKRKTERYPLHDNTLTIVEDIMFSKEYWKDVITDLYYYLNVGFSEKPLQCIYNNIFEYIISNNNGEERLLVIKTPESIEEFNEYARKQMGR